MVEKIIPGLKMSCYNTTLMGVLKGVTDYFQIPLTDAWLFGGSGHAFLINVHEVLCPSGPYVWRRGTFYKLVKNLGVEMTDLGFYHPKSTAEEIKQVEAVLRKKIDAGTPCSLLNMENQLISGYNEKQFLAQQPWPKVDFPPKTLTFQTWEELGKEIHINFFTYTHVEKADDRTTIKESLNYAVDLAKNPAKYRHEHYSIGLEAYDTWIKAVEAGYGSSHGNWWNGTVWMECRDMASKYFTETASKTRGETAEKALNLSRQYGEIAKLLNQASDKKLPDAEKIKVLREARKTEETCINGIQDLLNTL